VTFFRNISIILATVFLALLSGCTAIGYYEGLVHDREQTGMRNISAQSIPPGKRVEVTTAQGDSLSGIYAGSSMMPIEEYAGRFAAYQQAMPQQGGIPAVGETVTIRRQITRAMYRVRIAAYDLDEFYAYAVDDSALMSFKFEKISMHRALDGKVYDPRQIQRLIIQQHVPVLSILTLRTDKGIRSFHVSEIREIRGWHTQKSGRITGLAVGATADGVAIYFIVKLLKSLDDAFDDGWYPEGF
jgi:hypothetical protein